MPLNAYRQHKIYIIAIMGYGIGLENHEELVSYNNIKDEINKDRKSRKNMGVKRNDQSYKAEKTQEKIF